MGYWNATDLLGGTTLTENEKVKILIILENNPVSANGIFEVSDAYCPISFLISGRYNEQGGINIKDSNELSLKYFEKYILHLLENEQIKIKKMNDKHFYDKVILSKEEYEKDIENIEYFINYFIEQDLILINDKKVGICFINNYIFEELQKTSFTIKKDLDKLVNEKLKTVKQIPKTDFEKKFEKDFIESHGFGYIFKNSSELKNTIDSLNNDYRYVHNEAFSFYASLFNYENNFYKIIVEFEILYRMLSILRKALMPLLGMGSSYNNKETYINLSEAIIKFCKKRAK